MNVLIKSATIIDPRSDFNNKKQDILIERGTITKIASRISNPNNYREIRLDDLHVSPGWFDSSVSFGEPGYEERETLDNGLKVAGLSGFTTVVVNSETNPRVTTGSDVGFMIGKASNHAVQLLPSGALSLNGTGEILAELYDMQQAGAVVFYDYKQSATNTNFMKLALQYAATFNGLVCAFPQDDSIASNGVMHEDMMSTSLGLKGIPAMAETLQLRRDLELLSYTGGRLHIPTISCADSVEMIRQAKSRRLDVSCSVAIHNLIFSDEALSTFNTNFKVSPPLRGREDIKALRDGLKDGTIDMVTSDHNPLDIEHKKIEFDHATPGTIGLESAFGALNSIFPLKTTIRLLTRGKERFGVDETPINVGNKANISLFAPNTDYAFGEAQVISKSKNAIFRGSQLKGRAHGVVANGKILIH